MMKPYPELLYSHLPDQAKVLDVGCWGFRQVEIANQLGRSDIQQFGVDFAAGSGNCPPGFTFKSIDLNQEPVPFETDFFDLVVASHIIEHLRAPLTLFSECVRVCKPGGLLYVEAPSERALLLPGMPFKHDQFYSLSFFDDPTHVSRPWSPQAFHRLTRYYACEPIETGYRTSWPYRLLSPLLIPYALLTRNAKLLESTIWKSVGWASYLVAKKPETLTGCPKLNYYIPTTRE